MAHRKSLIQVKFRFREDLLRRLEREAKRNDRSTNAEIAHRLEQSLQKEDEAAYMGRIASMAAEKFSADVTEKLNAKFVRSFGAEGDEWSAERAQLVALALMGPILTRTQEPAAQDDPQKAAERTQLEAAAGLMTRPGVLRRLLQELSELDAQKPPTTGP